MPNPTCEVPFSPDESLFSEVLHNHANQQAASTIGVSVAPVATSNSAIAASNKNRANLVLPSFYYHPSRQIRKVDVNNRDDFRKYLELELDVSRLLEIFPHLWLAGQPQAARPLHYQIMIGRRVVLTEKADRHLTWSGSQIFLKPLPDFLLDYSIWDQHICTDDIVYESAVGFLLSYMWLITSKSDLRTALETGLVSAEVDWDFWVALSRAVLSKIKHQDLVGVNPRYLYGELRISRLNLLWRFLHRPWKVEDLLRGYTINNREYSRFASKSFAWLLGTFLYITVVLTAMQVGLASTELETSHTFQSVSYGFTVFSIVAPLSGIAIILVVLVFAVIFNWRYTRALHDKCRATYDRLLQNPAMTRSRQSHAVIPTATIRLKDPVLDQKNLGPNVCSVV